MSPKLNKIFRVLGVAAILVFVFCFLPLSRVHAQTTPSSDLGISWWDILGPGASGLARLTGAVVKAIGGAVSDSVGDVAATVVAVILYVFSWIAGVFIAIQVWVIEIILAAALNVVNIGIVQTGFSVCLALANLGFVLGIIIVALATILRRESYGIKNILWKLVVMAIFVNFALVIMAPIVGFSNNITNYFLQSFPGGGQGAAAFNNFGNSIMGAFQPQRLVAPENSQPQNSQSPGLGTTQTADQASVGLGNLVGGTLGQILAAILSLLLGLVTLVLIVIVLAVFIFMLLVRFLYLVFLCIIAPFAWMLWIFPKTSHHFNKWWETFIRWTFFPPIVIFFMWLVLVIGAQTNVLDPTIIAQTSASSGLPLFLQNLGLQLLGPTIGTFLIDFVMLGLMMGGMYVANTMSITGASAAMGAAKGIGDKVKGYASKKAGHHAERLKTAGRRYNPATRETTTWLQRVGSKMQGIPLPGMQGLGSVVAKQGSIQSEERTKSIEDYRKNSLTQLDNAGILTRANSSTAFVDSIEAAAVAQEVSRRNLTNQVAVPTMDRYLANSERMGNIQEILSTSPELAARTSAATPRINPATGVLETAAEAMARAIRDATRRIKDASKLDARVLDLAHNNPAISNISNDQITNIVLNLSNAHLNKIGSSEEAVLQQRNLTDAVRQLNTPAGRATLTPDQIAELDRIIQSMRRSPNWVNP